eukprot:6199664-Pleurochrysis_carterae.AAC.4
MKASRADEENCTRERVGAEVCRRTSKRLTRTETTYMHHFVLSRAFPHIRMLLPQKRMDTDTGKGSSMLTHEHAGANSYARPNAHSYTNALALARAPRLGFFKHSRPRTLERVQRDLSTQFEPIKTSVLSKKFCACLNSKRADSATKISAG